MPLVLQAAHDDARVAGLQEQIRTLEKVISSSTNTGERARLEGRLQRLQKELTILVERQALEARERTLTEDLQRDTADTLLEKLRAVDRTVEEGEARVHALVTRRKQVSTDRDALVAALDSAKAGPAQSADRVAEQEERIYTRNEELRSLALQREAAEMDIELAREADALRKSIKAYDPNVRPSLRALFDSYTRWRDSKKAQGQIFGISTNLERNLKVSQSTLDLIQQKLAKYDEELALLEKQISFFNSDARVEKLIANQRSQKKALGERLPLIASQIEAIQHAQQSLKMRQDLLAAAAALHREQFEALQDAYYRRLRWPVAALAGLLVLYLACAYALFPIVLRNEDLLLAKRLARYAAVLLAVGTMAGFLFDDLTMVAATLGVVSAALVISLQDVCTSVFGWFVIMLGGKFGVGDRLEVDGSRGDVIDIQLLRTTLLEVNGWLGADQPTGRVIILPNNFIFKTKVFNFTHGHPYIWGKIDVTITFATPVSLAMGLFQRVLTEETREEFAAAQLASAVMKRRYGVEDATYQPKIYTLIGDHGITFSLFYVAHYRSCSTLRNRINRRLITELESTPQVQLAYNTMNLIHTQNSSGIPSAVMGGDVTTAPFPSTATTAVAPGHTTLAASVNLPQAERVNGVG